MTFFPTVRSLSRALREQRQETTFQEERAEMAESKLRAVQHLIRCSDPVAHLEGIGNSVDRQTETVFTKDMTSTTSRPTPMVEHVRNLLDKLDIENDDHKRAELRDSLLELADLYGGDVASEVRSYGLPA